MAHTLFCRVAPGAVTDRSIRTPTSGSAPSTPEYADQPEEDRLVRVPGQQPIDQLAPGTQDLTWQPHKRLHERLELQPQHPTLVRAVLLVPAARRLRQGQRPPRLQVPRQRRH